MSVVTLCQYTGPENLYIEAHYDTGEVYTCPYPGVPETPAFAPLREYLLTHTPDAAPLEPQKDAKIGQFEAHTKQIYAAGVPAHVKGVSYLFDTRTGERASSNWLLLDAVILRALMVPVLEAQLFPRNIPTINDVSLTLDTAAEANAFWVELMTNDANIAAAGAVLRKAVKDCTTKEQLDAVVDPR